jgi:hypothetical protein
MAARQLSNRAEAVSLAVALPLIARRSAVI